MTHPEKLWAVINRDASPQVVQRTNAGKYMIYDNQRDADKVVYRLNQDHKQSRWYTAEIIISWERETHE